MITTEVVDFSSSSTTTKPAEEANNNNINNTISEYHRHNDNVATATATTTTTNVSPSTTAASLSSWTRLKDPRIVRVSRAFGGKDRHSKVCTVRGLRDRRVRLSVMTAIQLYDLQDRLGLNQPSKVVDWLLNAAKNEIDELPPLQLPIPSPNFNPNLQQWLCSSSATASQVRVSGGKSSTKEAGDNCDNDNDDNDDDNEEKKHLHHQQQQECDENNNNMMKYNVNAVGYNPFMRWDPSSLSLSHAVTHQPTEQDFHGFNVLPLSSPSGLPVPPHSFFHHHNIGGGAAEFEQPATTRQINFHMLSSSSHHHHPSSSSAPLRPPLVHHDFTSHSLRPLHFLASHGHGGREPNKESNEFNSS